MGREAGRSHPGEQTHHDIESTELLHSEIYSILYLPLDPYVGLGCDSLDIRIPRRDQGRNGLDRLEINVHQNEVRPLRSKQHR